MLLEKLNIKVLVFVVLFLLTVFLSVFFIFYTPPSDGTTPDVPVTDTGNETSVFEGLANDPKGRHFDLDSVINDVPLSYEFSSLEPANEDSDEIYDYRVNVVSPETGEPDTLLVDLSTLGFMCIPKDASYSWEDIEQDIGVMKDFILLYPVTEDSFSEILGEYQEGDPIHLFLNVEEHGVSILEIVSDLCPV
jgi:hypothetical protein